MQTLNELAGEGGDDPVFALRIVAVDDGGEARFLSTDMQQTADRNGLTWEHADCPVQVDACWDGPRLKVRLRNPGSQRLAVDFYGPLATRLSERNAVAHVPQVGGVVFPVRDSNYLHHNSGQLASLFMILQMGGGGVALGHEKTSEDEGRYRSGIAVHGQGLAIGPHSAKISDQVGSAIELGMGKLVAGAPAADLGGVACFVENVLLEPESEQALGPYLVLPYEGAWTQGAALLREKRYRRLMKPRPGWFKPVHNCAELGGIEAQIPVFDPPSVVGYLISAGNTRVLTVANVAMRSGVDHPVTVTLPMPAKTLYDRVEYRYYDVRDGQAELRLKPYGVMALEVIA